MSQSIDNSLLEFQVLIVGDAGVGKSALVSRYKTGDFTPKYIETEVSKVSFYTNKGEYKLYLREVSKLSGCQHANACILMLDLTEISTYANIIQHYNNIKKAYGDIPIVICGNKVDSSERKVTHEELFTLYKKLNLQYYDISAKSNYNIEKPFLYLLRKLAKDDDITFR